MNWTEIQKKYPKAFDKLILTFPLQNRTKSAAGFYLAMYCIRNLYDFFDGEDIHVHIYQSPHNDHWFYMLWGELTPAIKGESRFRDHITPETATLECNNRPNTEEIAFLKAFEILEQRELGNRENNSDK